MKVCAYLFGAAMCAVTMSSIAAQAADASYVKINFDLILDASSPTNPDLVPIPIGHSAALMIDTSALPVTFMLSTPPRPSVQLPVTDLEIGQPSGVPVPNFDGGFAKWEVNQGEIYGYEGSYLSQDTPTFQMLKYFLDFKEFMEPPPTDNAYSFVLGLANGFQAAQNAGTLRVTYDHWRGGYIVTDTYLYDLRVTSVQSVPEPSSMAMLSIGISSMIAVIRLRRGRTL